jgi:hypothetical protein
MGNPVQIVDRPRRDPGCFAERNEWQHCVLCVHDLLTLVQEIS